MNAILFYLLKVTFLENYKKTIGGEIKSVNDLIDCLKSMEQKILCTGTGFDKKRYHLKLNRFHIYFI